MALNDPQWGKRGNDGPPDLDEIFRKFNQKLGGLFGRGSGSEGPPSGPSKTAMGGGILLVVGLVLAIWLASGFYIVEEGKRGIVLRLGKYLETTLAGLHWRFPYPIESHELVNILQVRAIEVGHRNNQKTKVPQEALMLTDDQNIVDVQFAVQYTLKSAEDFLFNNNQPDEAVRQVAETAMREIVGKNKMDYVLYEGRGPLAASARVLMQQILDRYKTGILISTVTLQNAQPPEPVQASFDDAVRAKQDRERLKNEGQAYANDVVPKAGGLAARLREEANAHRERVVANAEGEASRFRQVLTEYEKAPQVTRERMYLDMMQQVMSGTSKVLIDQKSGGGNLLYLPLDKLMQMSAGSTPGTAGEVVAGKPVTVTDSQSGAIAPADIPRSQQLRGRDQK
jgi:membrane protease subunit HflK